MDSLFVTVLFLLTVLPANVSTESGTDVNTLLTQLFTTNNYNKKIRPLTDQTQAVQISMDFFLNAIIDFDEQDESLKTSGYLSFIWIDEYLEWDPALHNSPTEIFIPQDDIWKPDVSLRNAFKSFTGLGSSYLNVRVTSDGLVWWNPFQVLQSTCAVDITYFPFDKQKCELKFTAWSYSKAEVEINMGSRGVELEDYIENSAWKLVDTSARETNTEEAAVYFTLTLKRKSGFYIINVIIPVVLLSVLSVFTFILPITSGERASYAVTVFLALAVFLTIIADELPKNSENTSILAIYLMLVSSWSTLIVVLCLVESRLAIRDENRTPINFVFMAFVKVADFFTCKKCKKSVSPKEFSPKSSLRKGLDVEKSVTWIQVVNSMDFIFFWTSFIFTFVCTVILGALAVNGAK
ncbi:acetylcholine receptor subunit delta-like [Mercenaria mercenaria]|uniref:acetylcholine receptor subunit delta-like n=1 Tax=Mercenaria mercenaria TaxID=6596 RepID=UPI00234E95C5|nr:acetylcholine receptor subunit delta-like [Mercenaria mercenaria]